MPDTSDLAPGTVIGQLTVVRRATPEERAPDHYGYFCKCLCSCGTSLFRHAAQLKYAKRLGTRSSCSPCSKAWVLQAFLRGQAKSVRKIKAANFKERWDSYGSLYSANDTRSMTLEIRREVAKETGYWPTGEADPSDWAGQLLAGDVFGFA